MLLLCELLQLFIPYFNLCSSQIAQKNDASIYSDGEAASMTPTFEPRGKYVYNVKFVIT